MVTASRDGLTDPSEGDHRAAHERLSTGSLARWARMCATHPWRVVAAGSGSSRVLIVLVATIGGSLRDKFEIPGSDTQKATDLIESKFASEQGAVLNVVFAAPAGPAARHAASARRRSRRRSRASSRRSSSPPTARPASRASATRSARRRSPKNGRIAYAEAQFDQTIEDTDRDQVVAVEDAVRQTVEPAGVTVEYNGEAEFPPIEQGTSEALGLLAAIIVLLIVFRTFVAMLDPDRARDHARSSRRSCCCSSSPA